LRVTLDPGAVSLPLLQIFDANPERRISRLEGNRRPSVERSLADIGTFGRETNRHR